MEYECKDCEKKFASEEGLNSHNRDVHSRNQEDETSKAVDPKKVKTMINWAVFLIIVALLFWGVTALVSGNSLPPTDQAGHIEQSPSSHVLKSPMDIRIQRHMLEHADGTGSLGVIINYDCQTYDCESGLITNLEAFASKYPEFVYVAPYKKMAAKIAVTRQGKILTLDSYDEEKIDDFINRKI